MASIEIAGFFAGVSDGSLQVPDALQKTIAAQEPHRVAAPLRQGSEMQDFAEKHVRKMDRLGRFGADSMAFNSSTRLPHDLSVFG
ncbi:hypothetical protein [Pseudomonas sp. P9_31]|uniref:hypothetical protein n=1 Tax=Pseudomonas sp. P9_31 TaxID=3043448 RepID=UPI002A36A3B8|nr:hypothetical protein [Pseudomonas sp. P9_31]WPN55474.1 hypothetical protein QMK51_14865 [Pseudomonas sp. P9_31]